MFFFCLFSTFLLIISQVYKSTKEKVENTKLGPKKSGFRQILVFNWHYY